VSKAQLRLGFMPFEQYRGHEENRSVKIMYWPRKQKLSKEDMNNQTPVARMQTALKHSLSVIIGDVVRLHDRAITVRTEQSDRLTQITCLGREEKDLHRVLVEFDLRPSTSGKRERTDFRVAFVPTHAMLSEVTWQHHTFSAHGTAPEAAGSVIAGFAAGFFFGQGPTHQAVSHRLHSVR